MEDGGNEAQEAQNVQVLVKEDCSIILHTGGPDHDENQQIDESIPQILAMVPSSKGNKSPISSILSPRGTSEKPNSKKNVGKPMKSLKNVNKASLSPKATQKKPADSEKPAQTKASKPKVSPAKPKAANQHPSPPKSTTKQVRGLRLLVQAVDKQHKTLKAAAFATFAAKRDRAASKSGSAARLHKHGSKEPLERQAAQQHASRPAKQQVPPLQERIGLRSSMLARVELAPVRTAKQSELLTAGRRLSGVSKRPTEASVSSRGRSLSPINRKPFVMVERVFARRRRDWVFKFFRLLEKGRIRTYHLAPNQEKFKNNLLATFISDLVHQQHLKSAFWYLKSSSSPKLINHDEGKPELIDHKDGVTDESRLHTGDRLLVSILKHRGNSRIKSSFLWAVFLTYFSKTLQRRLKHKSLELLRVRAAQHKQRERFVLLLILDAHHKQQMRAGLEAVINYPTNLRNHKLVRFLNVFALHKTLNVVRPVLETLADHTAQKARIKRMAALLTDRQEAIRQIEFGTKGVFARARQSFLEVKLALATIKRYAAAKAQISQIQATKASKAQRTKATPLAANRRLSNSKVTPQVVFEQAKNSSQKKQIPTPKPKEIVKEVKPFDNHGTMATSAQIRNSKSLRFKPIREERSIPQRKKSSGPEEQILVHKKGTRQNGIIEHDINSEEPRSNSQAVSDTEEPSLGQNKGITHAPSVDGLSISTMGDLSHQPTSHHQPQPHVQPSSSNRDLGERPQYHPAPMQLTTQFRSTRFPSLDMQRSESEEDLPRAPLSQRINLPLSTITPPKPATLSSPTALILGEPSDAPGTEQVYLTLTSSLVKEIEEAYRRGLGRFPTTTVHVPASLLRANPPIPPPDEEMLIDNASGGTSPRVAVEFSNPSLLGSHEKLFLNPVTEESKESDVDELTKHISFGSKKGSIGHDTFRHQEDKLSNHMSDQEDHQAGFASHRSQRVQNPEENEMNDRPDKKRLYETLDARIQPEFASKDTRSGYSTTIAAKKPNKGPTKDYLGVKKDSRILKMLFSQPDSSVTSKHANSYRSNASGSAGNADKLAADPGAVAEESWAHTAPLRHSKTGVSATTEDKLLARTLGSSTTGPLAANSSPKMAGGRWKP